MALYRFKILFSKCFFYEFNFLKCEREHIVEMVVLVNKLIVYLYRA